MNGQLVIRRAEAIDLPKILELARRLSEFNTPAWSDRKRRFDTDRAVLTSALNRNSASSVLVACREDRILAFMHLGGASDNDERRGIGHVSDVAVSPDAQGAGIADRLMDEAEKWASKRGYAWLSLSVFDENGRAIAFYEQRGFVRDAVRLLKPIARHDH